MRRYLLLLSFLFFISPASVGNDGNTLPEIGDPADRYLSPEKEFELGSQFLRELYRQDFILQDPELSNYVQSLGNRIASGLGNTKFTFFVVRDLRINAFAVPGGFIGINAGLILATRNEGELAGVIAHEIAHVTQRHIARFYAGGSKNTWTTLGSILASIALASQGEVDAAIALNLGTQAALYQNAINHTRQHEYEADRVGIQYLDQAGFNPADMAGFFDVIRSQSLESDTRFEILRTHPLSANRIAEAKARAAQLGERNVPSSLRYQQMKMRLTLLANDPARLIAHYEKNKAQSSLHRYAYLELLTRSSRYKEAQKEAEILLKAHPDDLHYNLSAVRLDMAKHDFERAEKRLTKLLVLYPNYTPLVLYYSDTLKLLNKHERNIRLIENYRHLHQNMPVKLYTSLAESLEKTGDTAHSQYTQAEYLYLNGKYDAAWQQIRASLKSEALDIATQNKAEKLRDLIEKAREELRRSV
jgi:predicted Zn-dependent protease